MYHCDQEAAAMMLSVFLVLYGTTTVVKAYIMFSSQTYVRIALFI